MTSLLLDRVRLVPQKCLSSVSVSSYSRPSTSCLKDLVMDRDAGPIPSDTMKIRFRLPGGFENCPVCWLCWNHTARTMMMAVAKSAQTKRTTSRIRYAQGWRSGEAPRTRLSSSSASRSDRAESIERRGLARRGVRSEGWRPECIV